jgi:hypothetical protein
MPHRPNPEDIYPTKEGDLIKEMLIAFAFVAVLIVGLALAFGSPFDLPVTIAHVAAHDPVLFEETAMRDLMGTSAIATYGPPYTPGPAQQRIGGFSPEQWGGVSVPIDAAAIYVIDPLTQASHIDPSLKTALAEFTAAPVVQQNLWENDYYDALQNATATGETIAVQSGTYGPVAPMMQTLLGLGQSGFMDASLNAGASGNNGVYTYNFGQSLLFLQGEALGNVAGAKDLLGSQLGIAKDLGPYPGPWWLLPYSALYQFPPYSTAAAGDLLVALTMIGMFLVILFLPFIPILNKIPYYIPLYKIIWRRWYTRRDR